MPFLQLGLSVVLYLENRENSLAIPFFTIREAFEFSTSQTIYTTVKCHSETSSVIGTWYLDNVREGAFLGSV